MKIGWSFDFTPKRFAIGLGIFICLIIAFQFGESISFVPYALVQDANCLTLSDLNRSDIITAAILASNPCGIGIEPYYYPIGQTDANKQLFGVGCIGA